MMFRTGSPKNLYTNLGVLPGASYHDIKKAFRSIVNVCHPDKVSQDDPDKAAKNDRFIKATEAWEILRDPVARNRYDCFRGFSSANRGSGAQPSFDVRQRIQELKSQNDFMGLLALAKDSALAFLPEERRRATACALEILTEARRFSDIESRIVFDFALPESVRDQALALLIRHFKETKDASGLLRLAKSDGLSLKVRTETGLEALTILLSLGQLEMVRDELGKSYAIPKQVHNRTWQLLITAYVKNGQADPLLAMATDAEHYGAGIRTRAGLAAADVLYAGRDIAALAEWANSAELVENVRAKMRDKAYECRVDQLYESQDEDGLAAMAAAADCPDAIRSKARQYYLDVCLAHQNVEPVITHLVGERNFIRLVAIAQERTDWPIGLRQHVVTRAIEACLSAGEYKILSGLGKTYAVTPDPFADFIREQVRLHIDDVFDSKVKKLLDRHQIKELLNFLTQAKDANFFKVQITLDRALNSCVEKGDWQVLAHIAEVYSSDKSALGETIASAAQVRIAAAYAMSGHAERLITQGQIPELFEFALKSDNLPYDLRQAIVDNGIAACLSVNDWNTLARFTYRQYSYSDGTIQNSLCNRTEKATDLAYKRSGHTEQMLAEGKRGELIEFAMKCEGLSIRLVKEIIDRALQACVECQDWGTLAYLSKKYACSQRYEEEKVGRAAERLLPANYAV